MIRVHGARENNLKDVSVELPKRRLTAGGIVFEGTPADLVAARATLTGEHLAAYAGT
jgi:excinuclease UvrABC ATPase subunit